MAKRLPAPADFVIIPGNKSGLSTWLRVPGADGYIIDYFRSDKPASLIRRIYSQNVRKNILGLENGVEYFATIRAFHYYRAEEIIGERSKPFYFVPISNSLTAQPIICLEVGESQYIEWDFKNDIPEVVFKSGDTSIASVTQDGEVTGYAPGHTTITVTMDVRHKFTVDIYVDRTINRDISHTTTLMFTGDIMCPPSSQRYYREGGFDFSTLFPSTIRDILSSADYTAGFLKTVCDDSSPYESELMRLPSGTSNLNTPSTFVYALRDAGFKGLFTASSHNRDWGMSGLKNTKKAILNAGMNHIGALDDNPIIKVINGLRIAFISLTQLTTNVDNDASNISPGQYAKYSDSRVEKYIKIAEDKKADLIIVFMSWGQKNTALTSIKQRISAQYIADAGADMIIGSGPHILQAYEEIHASDGRIVPCLYSLGNFFSGMTEVYPNKVGAIAKVTILEAADTYSCRMELIPTVITSINGNNVVCPVEPVVNAAQDKANQYIREFFPDELLDSTDKNALSIQGSHILNTLSKKLKCGFYYSEPDITALIENRGEYALIDLLNFVDADDREELLAEYIKQLNMIYPSGRIILLRLAFSEYGVNDSEILECDDLTKYNHILYDLEEYVINTIQPIVIDISEYYFQDLSSEDDAISFEPGFYRHAAKIISNILSGKYRQFYFNEMDDEIWLERVLRYHSSIMKERTLQRMLLNKYEATDLFISNRNINFLREFKSQLLLLKTMHAELPYVKTILEDDYDSIPLVRAAEEMVEEMKEEE